MIGVNQDYFAPDKVEVELNSGRTWITMEEAVRLHAYLGHVIANPFVLPARPVKLFQLYDCHGRGA